MSTISQPDAVRSRMNRLYAALRKASQGSFMANGGPYYGVPKWVVVAFVRARFENRDPVMACVAAHYGADHARKMADDPKWPGWAHGRAWSSKLSEIEASLRRPAEVAA